ncbi:GNAT family N-acetyltransferase [Oceanobacillus damuensis]|uniref:GNAT family N-acetyltransferase n=1 Tax=Oceanobacillus damuensis TaxID=937928 RepID=UPI00082A09DD|nr:GNAT family N-acetyltransferase [Oceanobacillus damuensis]
MATIQRASKGDASEILAIQKLAYISEAELYNDYEIMPLKEDMETALNSFDKNIVLKYINDEGKIVGSVRAYEENGECHINKLMVHPDYQNQGIGRKLLEEIKRILKMLPLSYLQAVYLRKILLYMKSLVIKAIKQVSLMLKIQSFYLWKSKDLKRNNDVNSICTTGNEYFFNEPDFFVSPFPLLMY